MRTGFRASQGCCTRHLGCKTQQPVQDGDAAFHTAEILQVLEASTSQTEKQRRALTPGTFFSVGPAIEKQQERMQM